MYPSEKHQLESLTFKRNLSWIFFPQPAHSWGPATFPQSSLTAMIMTTLSTFYKMTTLSSAVVYKIWISLISTPFPPQWSCPTNILSFRLSSFLVVNQNLRPLPSAFNSFYFHSLLFVVMDCPSSELEGHHCILWGLEELLFYTALLIFFFFFFCVIVSFIFFQFLLF